MPNRTFTLRRLFLFVAMVGCVCTIPSAYTAGRFAGARVVFDEISEYRGTHSGVPLYEEGQPAAILWIQKDIKAGEDRHMTVRKPGCGAHWLITDSEWIDKDFEDVAFSHKNDYLVDLLNGPTTNVK